MAKGFSSDFYDAENQFHILYNEDNKKRENKLLESALMTRLRYDFLFSENIIFSRDDILDGAFFKLTSPKTIHNWLGLKDDDPSPITIMSPTGNLGNDLLEWIKKPDRNTLNAEPFLIAPETRSPDFIKEFSLLPSNSVNNYKDLANKIASVLGNAALADELKTFWSQWVEPEPIQKYYTIVNFKNAPKYDIYMLKTIGSGVLPIYNIVEGSKEAVDAMSLYKAAINKFSQNNKWDRGGLVNWLYEHLPKNTNIAIAVRDQLNIQICRAKALTYGTNHETLSHALLFEASENKSSQLYKNDTFNQKEANPIKLGIPECIIQWLSSSECNYEEFINKVANERNEWLKKNNVENLEKYANKIASTMNELGVITNKPSDISVTIIRPLISVGSKVIDIAIKLIPVEQWLQYLFMLVNCGITEILKSKKFPDWIDKYKQEKKITNQLNRSLQLRMRVIENKDYKNHKKKYFGKNRNGE